MDFTDIQQHSINQMHDELQKRDERIRELEEDFEAERRAREQLAERIQKTLIDPAYAERDQWQEACGQNYVRATEAEMRLEELESQPCPHIVTSAEGTQYCSLAEERIRELEKALEHIAMLERDFMSDPLTNAGVDHDKAKVARDALEKKGR